MLHRKFELILGFFNEFLKLLKNWSNTLYYSTWSMAKFHQKRLRENSPFLHFFSDTYICTYVA